MAEEYSQMSWDYRDSEKKQWHSHMRPDLWSLPCNGLIPSWLVLRMMWGWCCILLYFLHFSLHTYFVPSSGQPQRSGPDEHHPSGHITKWRRINVDTTSFWHQMPTGTAFMLMKISKYPFRSIFQSPSDMDFIFQVPVSSDKVYKEICLVSRCSRVQ